MKATRRLAHLVARVAAKLEHYRDLVTTALGEDAPVKERLISHVCINTQNTWAEFCRAYAMSTALNPTRLGGEAIILSDTTVRSESDVVSAAVRLLRGHVYQRGRWKRRDEPPWHDPNTLLLTLDGVGASNSEEIRTAFSLGSRVFEDLPVFRNFYAHRSEHTAMKARRIAYKYGIPMLRRPTEIICRATPRAPQQPVVLEWIDDIWVTVQILCR